MKAKDFAVWLLLVASLGCDARGGGDGTDIGTQVGTETGGGYDTGSADASSPGTSALTDTLASIIQEAYDFDSPGVLERMLALYADDPLVVSASGGRVTVSADSVRQGVRSFWDQAGQNMRDAEWRWDRALAVPLGPDAAVLTGEWSIPHIAPDGQPHLIEGAWTAVFQRVDGDWKIVHEHLSSPTQ